MITREKLVTAIKINPQIIAAIKKKMGLGIGFTLLTPTLEHRRRKRGKGAQGLFVWPLVSPGPALGGDKDREVTAKWLTTDNLFRGKT